MTLETPDLRPEDLDRIAADLLRELDQF